MKLPNTYWLASAALTLIGCNSVETGFVPLYVAEPDTEVNPVTSEVECLYPGGEAEPVSFVEVDVSQFNALSLMIVAENNLQDVLITVQQNNPTETFQVSNQIQPVRFDFRWECDSTGFTAGQGPIRLPAFGADRPFCLDRRDETTGNFSGFDVVAATGAAIEPGERGVIEVRIAPPQMLTSMQDAFDIAVRADNCCRQAGSCQEASEAQPSDNSECQALQDVFDRVGGNLSANSLPDLRRWRPFVAHTSAAQGGPVPYNMRLRGRFEGLTPYGDLITSTDFVQDIGFCEGCGTSSLLQCANR